MKKIIVLVLVLIVIGVGLFFGVKKKEDVVSEPRSVSRIHAPAQVVPLMFEEKKKVLSVKNKKFDTKKVKTKKKDSFSEYKKTELNFFNKPFFVVEGLFASHLEIASKKLIGNVGGHFVYDTPGENTFPLIYSPESEAYGYFTGEVIVNGGYAKALELIQSKSLEVIFKNEVAEQIIFKIDDLNDLYGLEGLKTIPHSKVEPDVKFSRINQI